MLPESGPPMKRQMTGRAPAKNPERQEKQRAAVPWNPSDCERLLEQLHGRPPRESLRPKTGV